MKAILLAAGKGSRISDNIGPIPKSTLEIEGKPIIRRTVEMLIGEGIEVAVCTGYRYQNIEDALHGLNVKYFNNPFYDVTNNIASLWFARDFIKDDDCLILSADVVFNEDVLQLLISARGDLIMVTDSTRIEDGDYFFSKSVDGKIQKYGPDIPLGERDCEYVGLDKISKKYSSDFAETLNRMVVAGETQCYFEYVFFSYIGQENPSLTTLDIAGCTWREIDRIDDYEKAVSEFHLPKEF